METVGSSVRSRSETSSGNQNSSSALNSIPKPLRKRPSHPDTSQVPPVLPKIAPPTRIQQYAHKPSSNQITINHTLQPASWIIRLLTRQNLALEAGILRQYSQYGWQCTLIANPLPASLIRALWKESPGYLVLVRPCEADLSNSKDLLCMDILRRVFRDGLRLKSSDAHWGAISRLLKRVKFNDEESVLFAINIPEPRAAPDLLNHLAMCGGICAADALLQGAVKAINNTPTKLRWHAREDIQIFGRTIGGDAIVTIVLCEKFTTLEERMLSAWICKHIMAARTRALHRMSPRAASRSWNFKMSLTAPKGQKPNTSSIWLLWEFRNLLEIGNPIAPGVCSTIIAFRAFLLDALRELKRRIDNQANQIVTQILNGPA